MKEELEIVKKCIEEQIEYVKYKFNHRMPLSYSDKQLLFISLQTMIMIQEHQEKEKKNE